MLVCLGRTGNPACGFVSVMSVSVEAVSALVAEGVNVRVLLILVIEGDVAAVRAIDLVHAHKIRELCSASPV